MAELAGIAFLVLIGIIWMIVRGAEQIEAEREDEHYG